MNRVGYLGYQLTKTYFFSVLNANLVKYFNKRQAEFNEL